MRDIPSARVGDDSAGDLAVVAGYGDPSDTGRYIVVLRDNADPEAAARQHETRYGARADRFFRSALKGYAANIPESRVEEMRRDPSVKMVSRNRTFRAAAQTTPTGVSRIKANTVPGTGDGVQVAVLDSGIDLNHIDLAANIAGGVDCDAPSLATSTTARATGRTSPARSPRSTIRSAFVVSLLPRSLLAARVLDDVGTGDDVSLICGLDWVDARSPAHNGQIRVANMSIEAPIPNVDAHDDCGFTIGDPVHMAVCQVVEDGVAIVVAAGNNHDNIKDIAPAAYNEVITVTALEDWDGAPCSVDPTHAADDTFPNFSNFATLSSDRAHTIAAPGVNILSTWPNDNLAFSDGTSMASPHVAGAAARYLQTHPGHVAGACCLRSCSMRPSRRT